MVLEERVTIAQKDKEVLADLLKEYQPFIRKVVFDTCNRYVEWGRDEELSIGLIAFEEAIHRFDHNKGNFLSLSRQVIKSRVIDYLRKENRHNNLAIDQIKETLLIQQVNPLVEEIEELQKYLVIFNISFQDLPSISPVKRTLREELKLVAKTIAVSDTLMLHLLEKKQIPVKALAQESKISSKKIERNRKYVITMTLIWHLELPSLQEYIK
ncbi:MAG: sigma-70 family RNA polymerase sigma factor [Vulcanibacillus sp.]